MHRRRPRAGVVHGRAHCHGNGQGRRVGAGRGARGRVVARRRGVERAGGGRARPAGRGGRRHAQGGVSRSLPVDGRGRLPSRGRSCGEGRGGCCRAGRMRDGNAPPGRHRRRAGEVRRPVRAGGRAPAFGAVGSHGPRPAAGTASRLACRRGRSLRCRPAQPRVRAPRVHAPVRCGGERAHPPGEERSEEPRRRRAGCGPAPRPAGEHARHRHPERPPCRRRHRVQAARRRACCRRLRAGGAGHGLRCLERAPGGRRAPAPRPRLVGLLTMASSCSAMRAAGSWTGRCRSSRWASTRRSVAAASRASCWPVWRPMRATWARRRARSRCVRATSVRRRFTRRSASTRWARARATTRTARTPSSWRARCHSPRTTWPACSCRSTPPARRPPCASGISAATWLARSLPAPPWRARSSWLSSRPATRRPPPSWTAKATSWPTSWPRRWISTRASAAWCPR